jgi:cell division septation protein DedD
MDSTRKREAEIKKETLEGLAAFRKRQEELDRLKTGDGAEEPDVMAPKDEWAHAGRKRRREREGLVKGIKLRKGSGGAAAVASGEEGKENGVSPSSHGPTETSESKAAEPPKKQGEAGKGDAKVDESSEKSDEETAARPGSAIGKTDKDLRKGGSGLVDYGSDDDDW